MGKVRRGKARRKGGSMKGRECEKGGSVKREGV